MCVCTCVCAQGEGERGALACKGVAARQVCGPTHAHTRTLCMRCVGSPFSRASRHHLNPAASSCCAPPPSLQSILTGESGSVAKDAAPVGGGRVVVQDKTNTLFR